jgi:hypothetical protein
VSAHLDLGPCVYCGRPAQERHHFTARLRPDEPYLDAGATLALCRRCHDTETALWREFGLDRIEHPTLARARRTTWTLGRVVAAERAVEPSTLRPFHEVLVVITGELAALVGTGAEP